LKDGLDKWLFFFNNSKDLDAQKLPSQLQEPEYQEAAGVLEMLTQDEIERQRIYDREKARRDRLSYEKMMERTVNELEQSEKEKELANKEKELANKEKAKAEKEKQRAEKKSKQLEQKSKQLEQKLEAEKRMFLIDQIHF
jgi:hypothetical protein